MKIDRKDFLKMAGGAIAGGAAGCLFSGAPFDALQWIVEWTQDQHVPLEEMRNLLKISAEYVLIHAISVSG